MNKHEQAEARTRIDAKLCGAVAKKLGVTPQQITIEKWITRASGIEAPVFAVPIEKRDSARSLGLETK